MSSLENAIRLVTQAVHQDTAKNYEEAARCYRDAVVIFRTIANSGRVSQKVKKAIDDKTDLYEARLKKLDRYLLSQADLSKLFRDCVAHELSLQEENNDDVRSLEGVKSVDSVELYENPYLKRGLDTIEKAKREDAKSHFAEAIHFYEQGAGQLLDAIRRGRVAPEQADCVRIKCLLLHDRCELIRNHLEHGAPLKVRKESLDSFEHSLEGSPESGSPLPLMEEERTLLMEEVQSNAANSVAGSTHSLYPTCVEIRRTESVVSGHSDFLSAEVIKEERPKSLTPNSQIPLVDMGSELKLSVHSVDSHISSTGSNNHSLYLATSGRSSCSVENLILLRSDSRQGKSFLDAEKTFSMSMSQLSVGERDRNVTELTCMNSKIEIDDDEHHRGHSANSHIGDSGSDSGFSDPSAKTGPGTPIDIPASPQPGDERKSPLSDIDSLDIVPSLPLPSPDLHSHKGSPTPSSSSSSVTGRRKQRRTGSSVKIEEVVTVLSEEHVVDGKVKVKHQEAYMPRSQTSERAPYMPSRAMAREHQDDEDDINKGCYYFMACLDSFWIL